MTLRISWSALRVHEECKQKSKLKRQRKSSPAQDIRMFFHGNVVDLIMRRWLEDEHREPGVMPSQVEEMFESYGAEVVEKDQGVLRWRRGEKAKKVEFSKELLVRLEPLLEEHILPYEFAPEWWFSDIPVQISFLDGTPAVIHLVGGIDILTRRGPDHWVAFDLKATADRTYHRKVLGQARFYDLAIESALGTPTRDFVFIQPMVEGEPVVSAQITDEHRVDILRRIERMCHDIWRDDDEPKPTTGGCNWCEVRHACVRFKPIGGTKNYVDFGRGSK